MKISIIFSAFTVGLAVTTEYFTTSSTTTTTTTTTTDLGTSSPTTLNYGSTTTIDIKQYLLQEGKALEDNTKELQSAWLNDKEKSINNLSMQNSIQFGLNSGLQTKGQPSYDYNYDYEKGYKGSQRCWKCDGPTAQKCQSDTSKVVECQENQVCEIVVRNNGWDNGNVKLWVTSQCKKEDVCKTEMASNTRSCRPSENGSHCLACCSGKKCSAKGYDITTAITEMLNA